MLRNTKSKLLIFYLRELYNSIIFFHNSSFVLPCPSLSKSRSISKRIKPHTGTRIRTSAIAAKYISFILSGPPFGLLIACTVPIRKLIETLDAKSFAGVPHLEPSVASTLVGVGEGLGVGTESGVGTGLGEGLGVATGSGVGTGVGVGEGIESLVVICVLVTNPKI